MRIKIISSIIEILKYLHDDKKVVFDIGDKVTWNWKSQFVFDNNDEEIFTVTGYYECGVETDSGGAIANFWLKRV